MANAAGKWRLAAVLVAAAVGAGAGPAGPGGEPVRYGEPGLLAELADPQVSESSGLACSRRTEGAFWTHNDSGDGPRIYAFDAAGELLAAFDVEGAQARDWEDMASFARGEEAPLLLLADVGDNRRQRAGCVLYLVAEPAVGEDREDDEGGAEQRRTAELVRTIEFTYEDGPRDCEAVAVDPTGGAVYLVEKSLLKPAGVYELPLATDGDGGPAVARRVAAVPVRAATAMDISPDGRRALVLTYLHGFEYARAADETWAQAFGRPPRLVRMPPRPQGESLCYGPDGVTLYLTSEGSPMPLWRVPVADG